MIVAESEPSGEIGEDDDASNDVVKWLEQQMMVHGIDDCEWIGNLRTFEAADSSGTVAAEPAELEDVTWDVQDSTADGEADLAPGVPEAVESMTKLLARLQMVEQNGWNPRKLIFHRLGSAPPVKLGFSEVQ